MSFRGGGTAGGGVPSKAGPEYVRHVPKFLQKYEHLIEKREGQRVVRSSAPADTATNEYLSSFEDEFNDELVGATIVRDERDEDEADREQGAAGEEAEDSVRGGGVRGGGKGGGARGFKSDQEQPAQASGAKPREPNSKAVKMKDQGNAAYARGDFEKAAECFSAAIAADPDCAALFSNRSAAFASGRKFEDALKDARLAVRLEPCWPKAFSRLGAALVGLKRYDEAEEAYSEGLLQDPESAALKESLQQVREKIKQKEEADEASGRVVFRKRKKGSLATDMSVKKMEGSHAKRSVSKANGNTNLLSFSEDDEQ